MDSSRLPQVPRPVLTAFLALASLALPALLTSCGTASGTSAGGGRSTAYGPRLNPNHPALVARNQRIQAEPRGAHYIGRRYWLEGTRFWGFVRKPGQSWNSAKLVVMGEHKKKVPDRLPESSPDGRTHGFDHNYEYKLWGYFSGERIYDPNSNQILPEFVLQDYELISSSPGFLFHPDQRFEKKRIPAPPRF